jgi:hypothetical protein
MSIFKMIKLFECLQLAWNYTMKPETSLTVAIFEISNSTHINNATTKFIWGNSDYVELQKINQLSHFGNLVQINYKYKQPHYI